MNPSWKTLESSMKSPWNILETLLKSFWNLLKGLFWNFLESLVKHYWNTLETSLKQLGTFWNTFEIFITFPSLKHPWKYLRSLLNFLKTILKLPRKCFQPLLDVASNPLKNTPETTLKCSWQTPETSLKYTWNFL